jgi:hypothetical protein
MENKKIQRWSIIRDASLPIKPSWKKANEILEQISYKGEIYYADAEENAPVFAVRELLVKASAGDLAMDNYPLTYKDVQRFLLKGFIRDIRIIQRIFGASELAPKAEKRKPSAPVNIKQAILDKVTKAPLMLNLARVFDDFATNHEKYLSAAKELVTEGKIVIFQQNEKSLLILAKPKGRSS